MCFLCILSSFNFGLAKTKTIARFSQFDASQNKQTNKKKQTGESVPNKVTPDKLHTPRSKPGMDINFGSRNFQGNTTIAQKTGCC